MTQGDTHEGAVHAMGTVFGKLSASRKAFAALVKTTASHAVPVCQGAI
jgi:hypothetical protein